MRRGHRQGREGGTGGALVGRDPHLQVGPGNGCEEWRDASPVAGDRQRRRRLQRREQLGPAPVLRDDPAGGYRRRRAAGTPGAGGRRDANLAVERKRLEPAGDGLPPPGATAPTASPSTTRRSAP